VKAKFRRIKELKGAEALFSKEINFQLRGIVI